MKRAVSTVAHKRERYKTNLSAFQVHSTVLVINNFYQTWPVASAFLTCGVKASVADLVAQMSDTSTSAPSKTKLQASKSASVSEAAYQKKKSLKFSFELPRNLAFLMYGAIYQGVFQYYLYNKWFPVWFGTKNDMITVTAKVMFDLIWIAPFICWPLAYLSKSIFSGGTFRDGLRKYIFDLKHTNLVRHFYMIWIPAKVRLMQYVVSCVKLFHNPITSLFVQGYRVNRHLHHVPLFC